VKKLKGRLEIIIGPMYSGKTEELIRRIIRRRIAKQEGLVFKPVIDTRDKSLVKSRAGTVIEAIPISQISDILKYIEKGKVNFISIDEIQFFSETIYDILENVLNKNIDVLSSGLNLDFKGEPFKSVEDLVIRADDITLLKAVCVVCGKDATRTQRLVLKNGNWLPASKRDDVILIDGSIESVKYEPRCRDCWEILD
jgi:thymidine kinase